jgi:hypothetical protein
MGVGCPFFGSFFGHLSRSIAGSKKTNKHSPKAPTSNKNLTSKLTNPLNQRKKPAMNLVANLSFYQGILNAPGVTKYRRECSDFRREPQR